MGHAALYFAPAGAKRVRSKRHDGRKSGTAHRGYILGGLPRRQLSKAPRLDRDGEQLCHGEEGLSRSAADRQRADDDGLARP